MKFVIQRVSHAQVTVEGAVTGSISRGFLVLIGIGQEDTRETADRLIRKMLGLRIFPDESGKTNLDLNAVNGSLLLISQFTLYANCRKGNRPSFGNAGKPEMAEDLYRYIIQSCENALGTGRVQTGSFGADMKVELLNDGPFTILLDSKEL